MLSPLDGDVGHGGTDADGDDDGDGTWCTLCRDFKWKLHPLRQVCQLDFFLLNDLDVINSPYPFRNTC